MNVLAIDPGKTTGFAWWVKDGTVQYSSGVMPFTGFNASAFIRDLAANHHWDLWVCEDFVIGMGTLKKSRDGNLAIELIGVSRYIAGEAGINFITQKPSEAKTFGTAAKINAMGWKPPGPGDHALSASRHLLLALANKREPGVLERLVQVTHQ